MVTKHDDEVPRDRPFDPWRCARTDAAKAVVADVLNQLQNYERHFTLRKRARRANDQSVFERTVETVVCDLIHRELTEPDGWVAISLSNRILGRAHRYGSPVLNKTLPELLERMSSPEMSWLAVQKGHRSDFGPNRLTTIQATDRLRTRILEHRVGLTDLGRRRGGEVIILKGVKEDVFDTAPRLDYRDNATTNGYRREVEDINAWLEAADITVGDRIAGVDGVDFTDRQLRRVFNAGSFGLGGRLFGGFWQPMSKVQRRMGIRIEGDSVVTLDYRQMAPRIVYGLTQVPPPPGDAYAVPGLEGYRDGVKSLFAAMLFADRPLARKPQGTKKLLPKRHTVGDMMAMIAKHHQAIRDQFFRGEGLRVMFIESEILVRALNDLKDSATVALPIHDAVIVKRSAAEHATSFLKAAFRSSLGMEIEVGREE